MTEEKPILYSYWESSCSWRVRIALALKQVDYEYRSIEDTGEEYNRINPLGQVPALIVHGKSLFQSVAIIEYLDEAYPQKPSLLPDNILERAKVREIVEIINSGIQPFTNMAAAIIHSKDQEEQSKWILYWNIKGFTALESILKESSGIYCVGNQLTLADLFLVPQIARALLWKVKLEDFPVISRLNETLSKLDAFKKAQPSNQPDYPPQLK